MLSSDKTHIVPTYGETDTKWAQIYNLFVDKALGLDLVNNTVSSICSNDIAPTYQYQVYEAQSQFYRDMTYAPSKN